MKIIKVRKYSLLDNIYRFITNFRILKKDINFKWSFIKFLFLVKIFNIYDVINLESNKKTLLLILVRKYRSRGYIALSKLLVGSKQSFDNIDLLQTFKLKINSYRALGYTTIYATFPSYNKDILSFLEDELNFELDKERNLTYLLKNGNKNYITLIRTLNDN